MVLYVLISIGFKSIVNRFNLNVNGRNFEVPFRLTSLLSLCYVA